jgi:hypothetical protein
MAAAEMERGPMSAFILLAQATTLPPPPAPQANHPVSAFSVLLVIAIVLGSVTMIALSARRFRRRPAEISTEALRQPASDIAESVAAMVETEPSLADAPDANPIDPNLLSRLRRVTDSNPVERRKLGHRKPGGAPDVLAEHGDLLGTGGDELESDLTPPYPEPIPIRRRSASKWPDEPVIAHGSKAGGTSGSWSAGRGAAVSGLTNEELSQLETPRFVARAAQPLPRLKPEAKLPKSPAMPDPDELLLSELSSTVRELLFCANSGNLLHGFSLYSDPFLFRTMDDSGLDEDRFQEMFSNRPAKPVAEWARLAEVRDLERFGPDLVAATVVYAPRANGPRMPTERFRFLKDHDSQNWLIDDIAPLETAN